MVEMPIKGGNHNAMGRPTKRPPLAVLARLYGVYTAGEIGRMLNVPEATVRSWIARARKEHREEMARYAEMYPQRAVKGVL